MSPPTALPTIHRYSPTVRLSPSPCTEYTGTTLKKTYTWGSDLSGSLQGAGGVGGLLAVTDQVAAGKPSYFPTFDGNGNVSEYLTSAGATVAHYEYDPFGRSTSSTGTLASSFAHRFSTKPVDGPTGLYYYGYRFYDPATGRWPSRDPIEEWGGVNLYGFALNRSLSVIDRLGAAPDEPADNTVDWTDFIEEFMLNQMEGSMEVGLSVAFPVAPPLRGGMDISGTFRVFKCNDKDTGQQMVGFEFGVEVKVEFSFGAGVKLKTYPEPTNRQARDKNGKKLKNCSTSLSRGTSKGRQEVSPVLFLRVLRMENAHALTPALEDL